VGSSCACATSGWSREVADVDAAAGGFPVAEAPRFCPLCDLTTTAPSCPSDGVPTMPQHEPARALDATGARVVGDGYRLEALIAEGAMGQVFRARAGDGRPVAVKLLKRELCHDRRTLKRFYREARIARRLVGPHFVAVEAFGLDQSAGAPFIAMELVAGETLAALAPLPPRRAARLCAQVAEALARAADAGIVHRDLKPANVIVTTDAAGAELVKVTDFGVAKDLESADETLTQTGEPVGTPSTMAPEQIEGREVDTRTDLYALGCLLHRVVTGERLFRAQDLATLMRQHLLESPTPWPSPLPSGEVAPVVLARLRDMLVAKRPEDRPATASQVAPVLEAIAAGDDERAQRLLSALGAPDRDALHDETWRPSEPAEAQSAAMSAAAPVSMAPASAERVRPRRTRWLVVGAAAVAVALPLVLAAAPKTTAPQGEDAPPMHGAALRPVGAIPPPPAPWLGTSAATVAPAEQDAAAADDTRTLTLTSQPSAWVYRDGERLGRTPFELTISTETDPYDVELRHPGYVRKRVTLSATTSSPIDVALERSPGAQRDETAAPATPWKPKPF